MFIRLAMLCHAIPCYDVLYCDVLFYATADDFATHRQSHYCMYLSLQLDLNFFSPPPQRLLYYHHSSQTQPDPAENGERTHFPVAAACLSAPLPSHFTEQSRHAVPHSPQTAELSVP